MKRAIVAFVENNYALKLQAASLYMSLKFSQAPDTDLIVFGSPFALSQLHFNCIKVPYTTSNLWRDYPYLYSISCLNSPNATLLDDYDYILRSDVDTFVTPKWSNFYPAHYMVGQGSYLNNDEVKSHLLETANKLGLRHQGFFNIGSTHYGSALLVKEVHRLATEISEYLLSHDFLSTPGAWPGWYRGVTTLYASDLAVNHLVDSFTKEPSDLDFPSTSTDSILQHTHIHCWHTDNFFSKFAFQKGNYSHIKKAPQVPSIINAYCLHMSQLGKSALVYGRENFT